MVLNAVKLVKHGKVATLGKVYQNDMSFFGSRSWRLTIPGLPPAATIGPQDAVGIDELVTAEFGQVGTQFDGPGHIKMMARSGIWNIENLDLSQLVADKAYEFLFTWSPLKMKGATGSPGNPIAIY